MTNAEILTHVAFVIPAAGDEWEAICPSLHCGALADTPTTAIEAARGKMTAALGDLRNAGKPPPVESGYAVAEEMEERLRIQDEAGLPISLATHEVRIPLA